MEENLRFIIQIMDAAWFLELAIWALSWLVLCHGWAWWRERPGQRVAELVLLAGMTGLGQMAIIFFTGTKFYLLLRIVLQGILGALLLYTRSEYTFKARVVMWCSMLAGSCAINAIGGQCSFLVGQFLARGAAEGAVRLAVALLMIPLACYLHSFSFEESEQVPTSGLTAILIGDASILAMDLLEVCWANRDYHITVIFLVSYLFLLLMILAAMQGMHDMRVEQGEIVELQTEQQRLHSERELARLTEDNLEDLRSIRHDLKNQYAYMQILLTQRRYAELEEYFHQSSEHLLPQLGQFIDCGNRTVNTILNMELTKARKAEVEVTHQLVVPPVLPFGEDDLCSVLANLLDNAIEECVRLRQAGRKDASIRLELYPQKSYLFVLCRNTTDRTNLVRSGRGLRTTKGDERLHGHGTRIVTRIAEKYNGCTEFCLEDGAFVARLLLDMTVEEKK